MTSSGEDSKRSEERHEWALGRPGDEAARLLEDDSRYFLHQSSSTPCVNTVRRAEGIYIEDVSGRRFMDFHGNNVHHIGYSHPRLISALKAQLDELLFCPRRYTNARAVELACAMAELTGGALGKCLFAPSGSDAVEIALRLARGVTGRHKTISFLDSFHGAGFGAASVSGQILFRDPRLGPLVPGARFVQPPGSAGHPDASADKDQPARTCLSDIRAAFEEERDVAALIACPLDPSAYVPPPWFWGEVHQECCRRGALLIFDEIPYGLGKTGRMFGCEHYGVVPDILLTGKALGGGVVPIACVSAREDLDQLGELSIGHYTHEKNPFTAAAALATLRVIREEGLVERAARLGRTALDMAARLKGRHGVVGEIRGRGLALGIDVTGDDDGPGGGTRQVVRVLDRALQKGLSMKTTGQTLVLSPPLIITESELGRAYEILDESLTDVEREAGRTNRG